MRKVDEAKTEERRRHILTAAITCFKRSGFHGASINDICREAGMTPSHLYYYFDSKEALIVAVTEEDRRTTHVLYDNLHGKTDLLETFLVQQKVEFDRGPLVLERPLTYECIAEAARNERIGSVLTEYMDTLYPMLDRLVGEAQARGEIDPELDTRKLSRFIETIAVGQRVLEICGGDYDLAEVGRFAQALLAPKTKRPEKPTLKPAAKKTASRKRTS